MEVVDLSDGIVESNGVLRHYPAVPSGGIYDMTNSA